RGSDSGVCQELAARGVTTRRGRRARPTDRDPSHSRALADRESKRQFATRKDARWARVGGPAVRTRQIRSLQAGQSHADPNRKLLQGVTCRRRALAKIVLGSVFLERLALVGVLETESRARTCKRPTIGFLLLASASTSVQRSNSDAIRS